jgi:hypothetical protein
MYKTLLSCKSNITNVMVMPCSLMHSCISMLYQFFVILGFPGGTSIMLILLWSEYHVKVGCISILE